jgi:integrase
MTEQLVAAYSGEIEVSRDSFAPIRKLIDLPQPMEGIVDMLQRMRADRPVGAAPSMEAIWSRDMALIKLLLSNPLRKRNLAHMTWRPDNSGDLYQQADGSWWIRLPKSKFKNRTGAAGESIYDCEVQSSAWSDIERYIFIYRPKLLRYESDLVFLARLLPGSTKHRPWEGLSAKVHDLTAKYVPQCSGFGSHAFRHIVATSILKAEGGTHKTAARVLNDRVATVEKHYDGLTSNDGAREMGRLLGSQFGRM